jgi:hypothetical protein
MTDSSLQRLERAGMVLCLGLTIALFAGLLLLPRWGQLAWVALIGAAYIRLTIVIMRRERQLTLMTEREGGQRTTRDHRGQGHIGVVPQPQGACGGGVPHCDARAPSAAMAEYKAVFEATLAKTERLRALRLARAKEKASTLGTG